MVQEERNVCYDIVARADKDIGSMELLFSSGKMLFLLINLAAVNKRNNITINRIIIAEHFVDF